MTKQGFVDTLLQGNGYPAVGAFPEEFAFGGNQVKTEAYDPEGAKEVLEKAGWVDTDGDANPGEGRTGFEYPLADVSEPSGIAAACRVCTGNFKGNRHECGN